MFSTSLRSFLRKVRDIIPGRPDRVIIYGTQIDVWLSALGPESVVWKAMPRIRSVIMRPPDADVPRRKIRLKHRRTVVIPLMEPHIRTCPREYKSLMPDSQALKTLADKALFAEFVKKSGLAAHAPTSYARVVDAVFPCVLKRVDLSSGIGIVLVKSYDQLQAFFADAQWNGQKFILQSFVPGAREYVTHCVCRKGKVLWHCSYEYDLPTVETMRALGNITGVRPYTLPGRYIQIIEKFLMPLAYDGPCNVDFKFSEQGEIIVMEINPRLGGSLMHPDHAGRLAEALSHIIANARLRTFEPEPEERRLVGARGLEPRTR